MIFKFLIKIYQNHITVGIFIHKNLTSLFHTTQNKL